jgi:L-iditol 2-dehydrogenase
MPMNELWKRGVTITHSYAGPPADMRTALELIRARRVEVGPMISHRLGLAETQEGFRLTAAAGESMKVIIEPQR